MGRYADELEKIKEEIAKTKSALDEKNKIPRTRPARVVTVKSLSEIFPEMKAMEALWVLGETEYRFDFELDGDCWSSKIAGQECEISEECDTSFLVKTTVGSYSLRKEWIKKIRDITVKVKVDISPETKKLEKLYKRREELKDLIATEEKEEKEEREKEEKEQKAWFKKIDMIQRWCEDNIEDFEERKDYMWDALRDSGNYLYDTPYEIFETIYKEKK